MLIWLKPEFCTPEEYSWTYPSRTSFCPAFGELEKQSWTYPVFTPLVGAPPLTGKMFLDLSRVYLRPRSVDSTGKMFVELSRRRLPLSPNCANSKNVPGSISESLHSLAAHDANRNNIPRPIGDFKPWPLIEPCSTRKIFLELSEIVWDGCGLAACKSGRLTPHLPNLKRAHNRI